MRVKRLVLENISLSDPAVAAAKSYFAEGCVLYEMVFGFHLVLRSARLTSVQFISSDSNLLMPPDAVMGKLVIEYVSTCGNGEGA